MVWKKKFTIADNHIVRNPSPVFFKGGGGGGVESEKLKNKVEVCCRGRSS